MASLTNQPALSFPALRGLMGTRNYYVILMPLAQVPRFLQIPDGDELPADMRAQRKLVGSRIPDIASYILENEKDWLFSSLTASFDGDEEFIPSKENPDLGMLRLPLSSYLLVNDGQHRRAGIERALKSDPTLGAQNISVVLFPAEGLERNQQMFSDLNRTVQRTSRSLNIMYDHRDPLNEMTLALEPRVPLLRNRIEKESQSVSVRSAKLISLSALYDMSAEILGGKISQEEPEENLKKLEQTLTEVWLKLTAAIDQWQSIVIGELRPAEARAEFINAHAVFFYAIGGVVRLALQRGDGLEVLNGLGEIDWRRANPEWQGVCMLGADIITRRQTREALREHIAWKLDLRSSQPEPAFAVLN